jgi:hypothetical protein
MAQTQPQLGTLLQRFSKLDSENVSKSYKGITTSKGKEIGLFPITSTGVSTKPIKLAGELFLKSLAKGQLKKTQFDVNSVEWQHWANVDNGIYKRNGISIKEMSQEQRKLAFQLMQKALSAKGLKLSKES